jgi:uncharacterized membrane protein
MAAIIFSIAIIAAVLGYPLPSIPVVGPVFKIIILAAGIICGLKRFS